MSVKVSNLIIMCTNTSIYLVVKMKFIFQTVLECGRREKTLSGTADGVEQFNKWEIYIMKFALFCPNNAHCS